MSEELLDSKIKVEKPLTSVQIVKWWERRRWIFELTLIGSFLLFTYLVSGFEMKDYVYDHLKIAFLLEFIGGNILYCGYWIVELMFHFYSKKNRFKENCRRTLFYAGMGLTIVVSFFAVDAVIDFRFI